MTADKALSDNKNGQVYTFGPLIHNPVALADFERRNLKILSEDKIDCLKSEDTVVIRAHGIPPELTLRLEHTGAKILNGTCPLVQVNQNKCAEYAKLGYTIIFAGDKNHGEVLGIEGYGKKAAEDSGKDFNFFLVRDCEQALLASKKICDDKKNQNVVLMSQTTFSIEEFGRISIALKEKFPLIQVIKSICPATHERQSSLVKLCSQVEGVIVIGGKNSANTTRLYNTAEGICRHAALIESKEEIPPEFFTLKTVGLTAGASTPDDVIDEVEKTLCQS